MGLELGLSWGLSWAAAQMMLCVDDISKNSFIWFCFTINLNEF